MPGGGAGQGVPRLENLTDVTGVMMRFLHFLPMLQHSQKCTGHARPTSQYAICGPSCLLCAIPLDYKTSHAGKAGKFAGKKVGVSCMCPLSLAHTRCPFTCTRICRPSMHSLSYAHARAETKYS